MKRLTERRLAIASGQTDLTVDKVRAYRELWSRQGYELPPLGSRGSLLRRALRFGRAIAKHTGDLFRRCSMAEVEERLTICQTCTHFDGRSCNQCGCPASREEHWRNKLRWRSESCPVGKWPALSWWAEPPPKPHAPEVKTLPVAARHPLARHVTRWAVGVTSAPRPNPTLHRCVRSLQHAGWHDLTVFAEPRTDVQHLPCKSVVRPELLGCWRNYVQTLRDLYEAHPDAQAILVVQDDAVFARDTRAFLEHDLWPSAQAGVVSIYAPDYPGYEERGHCGAKLVTGTHLMGAVAMVYPRHVVGRILKHPLARDWRGAIGRVEEDPTKKKATDAWVGNVIRKLRLKSYFYDPSLAQHVADNSAIGHGGREQKRHGRKYRRSIKFQGESASAFDVFGKCLPWIRYDLPTGDQRFRADPDISDVPLTIVIPARDCDDLTVRCLDHLAWYGRKHWRVIYVDDGSAAGVADRVAAHGRKLGLNLSVIRNPVSVGFAKANNAAFAAAGGSHVLMLNNDAFIGPHCVQRLLRSLLRNPRTAAVGPLTGDDGHQSIKLERRRNNAGAIPDWSQIRYSPQLGSGACRRQFISEETMLTGFCCLIRAEALAALGGLSEDPGYPHGLGTDDEWCRRARKAGWKLFLVHDAFCAHLHKQSFKRHRIDRDAEQQLALKTLRRKSA